MSGFTFSPDEPRDIDSATANAKASSHATDIRGIYKRVMHHVVDCGAEGLSGALADECVQKKLKADNALTTPDTLAKAVDEQAEVIRGAKRIRQRQAERKAARRFKRHHPNAAARLKREKIRKESKPNQQKTREFQPPAAFRYKPFVDEPEFAPRYDPDLIHREISARALRFVRRTGYPPRDELEKSHIDMDELKPRTSPFPKNIEVAASMKNMKTAVLKEERRLRTLNQVRHDRMSYELDKEMKTLAGKPNTPVPLSPSDKQLISSQTHAVMALVNPVADSAIHKVMQLEQATPPAPTANAKLRVTANTIAKLATQKVMNSRKEATKIVRDAEKSAAEIKQGGASALHAAAIKAKLIRRQAQNKARRIKQEAWHLQQTLQAHANIVPK